MLCRSPSTGVLGTLLPTVSHSQQGGLVSCPDSDKSAADPLFHHQRTHLTTPQSRLPSPALQHPKPVAAEVAHPIEGGEWDFEETSVVPWPKFRRAQSESDLQSLWRSSSWKAATFAATGSLLSANTSFGAERDHFRGRLGPELELAIPEDAENSSEESAGEDGGQGPRAMASAVSGSVDEKADAKGKFGQKLESLKKHKNLARVKRSSSRSKDSSHTSLQMGLDGNSSGSASSFLKAEEPTRHSGHLEVLNIRRGSVTLEASRDVLERSMYAAPQKELFGPMSITDPGFGNGSGGSGRGESKRGNGCGYGDSNGVEGQYRRMLEADPGHPLILRNYARFLHEVKREPFKAEAYYERAILANPGNGEVLGEYAQLIWEVYRDENRALRYFDQALQACPDDCYLSGAYASFLWSSESDEIRSRPHGIVTGKQGPPQ